MASRPERLPSRRELLALSAALAATTLTAGAAIAGLAHRPTASVPIVPTVSQPAAPASPARRNLGSRADDAERLGDRPVGLAVVRRDRRARLDAAAARAKPVAGDRRQGQERHATLVPAIDVGDPRDDADLARPRRMIGATTSSAVPVAWLVARAAGLTALALLSASLWLGLAMSVRLLAPRRQKSLMGWHQTLMWCGLSMVALHAIALLLDPVMHFSIAVVLVPGARAVAPAGRQRRRGRRVADARARRPRSTSAAASRSAVGG